ncbi:MAG: hypothetical protein GWP59_02545 [Chlamydiales bacterium]|nr:AAC(3) family N-acetyltransferase [Chlamydiales bacterium]NCF70561.1 hypothetical protein [Chlamydiales bacterium]
MYFFTTSELSSCLKKLGVERNSQLLVHSDLSTLGLLKGKLKHTEYLEAISSTILGSIPNGNLMVPSFSYNYARSNKPFYYESTPSELDIFSEYIRKQKDSFRSLHPLFSFSAIGKDPKSLCGEVSRCAFGYNTPFDRLCEVNGKIIFLGADPGKAMTFIHHIEQLVGVSYFYHKTFFTPVFYNNKQVEGPFFAFVRHLGKVEYRHTPFKQAMIDNKLLKREELGMGYIYCCEARKILELGAKLINRDPCFFIQSPFYQTD